MRTIILLSVVIAAMTAGSNPQQPATAAGPLVVSSVNPRYFTIAPGHPGAGRAVYLTGSHIWNNLHDGTGPGAACSGSPEPFDYAAYLEFLKERGRNFRAAGRRQLLGRVAQRQDPRDGERRDDEG